MIIYEKVGKRQKTHENFPACIKLNERNSTEKISKSESSILLVGQRLGGIIMFECFFSKVSEFHKTMEVTFDRV